MNYLTILVEIGSLRRLQPLETLIVSLSDEWGCILDDENKYALIQRVGYKHSWNDVRMELEGSGFAVWLIIEHGGVTSEMVYVKTRRRRNGRGIYNKFIQYPSRNG